MYPAASACVEGILQKVESLEATSDRPVVVAIDGRSGTGKSTLAASLARSLTASLIEGDDFYAGGTKLHDLSDEALAALCIDWRKQRRVLSTLKSGQQAHYRPFDWEAFDGSLAARAVTIAPSPILLLEGVYAARPELRDLVDFSVLLTLPESERIERVLKREGTVSAWEEQWWRAEAWYFNHQAQANTFDMVLSGSSDR